MHTIRPPITPENRKQKTGTVRTPAVKKVYKKPFNSKQPSETANQTPCTY